MTTTRALQNTHLPARLIGLSGALAIAALIGCGNGEGSDTSTMGTGTGTTTGTSTGTSTGTTTGTSTGTTTGTATGTPPAMTVAEWLLDAGHFSYVHGTYGKPTYCGAFEVGLYPGYESVRCTDNTAYILSDNGDGTYRMEEAYYVYRISDQNPDGSWPWFIDDGYAGSIVWKMTPLATLAEATDEEAMEFEMEMVEGLGPDGWFEYLGSLGIKQKMIFSRGQADDALIDWKTADWDDATAAWVEYPHAFQDWAINVYPFGGGEPPEGVIGAFYSTVCDVDHQIDGAVIPDGAGGYLPTGPSYCAPGCRMATDAAPNGANGLPVCDATFQSELPLATGLQP